MKEQETEDNKKTRKACDQCRSRKVKCDGQPTCARCASKGYECTYNYVFKKRLRKKTKEVPDKPKRKRGRPRKIPIPIKDEIEEVSTSENNVNTFPTAMHINNLNNLNDLNTANFLHSQMNNNTHSTGVNGGLGLSSSNVNYTHGKDMGKGFFNVKPLIMSSNNGLSVASTPASAATDNSNYTFNTNTNTNFNLTNNDNTHYATNTSNYIGNVPHYDSFYHTPLLKQSSDAISANMSPTEITNGGNRPDNAPVELRLKKMENMISLLLDKVSNHSSESIHNQPLSSGSPSLMTRNITSGSVNSINSATINQNRYCENQTLSPSTTSQSLANGAANNCLNDNNDVNTLDSENTQKWFALLMHSSLFFLSPLGLKTLEKKMDKPEAMLPLKKIVTISTPFEKHILSVWTNPIMPSQLSPLPSRHDIECLIEALSVPFHVLKILDVTHLKHLLKLYCDHRDGLIPEPKFSYTDYFFMNTSLLVACLISYGLNSNTVTDFFHTPTFPSMREVSEKLLDNALFYYSRLSVISGGLYTIVGSIFLSLYADNISLSRAAYLISSTAIRQAQELGLHIEETYRNLSPQEKKLRLNIWWTCYIVDKELCIRWGQTPVINDKDVTAPALPEFEAFWSPNVVSPSKRSIHTLEINEILEKMLQNPSTTIDLEQFLLADYSFLVSKVYDNFLRSGALKHKKRSEVDKLLSDTLAELDHWRQCIPKRIRPVINVEKENEAFAYLEQLKANKNVQSINLMILATALHVRYHHLRLMVYRAYTKNCLLEYGDPVDQKIIVEPILSARSVLKVACLVDNRFGSYVSYFIFYPFNSFLAICGLYIYIDKEMPNMKSDLQLLIDVIKKHFTPFIVNEQRTEKGALIELVLRGMLYATYVTCVDRYGEIKLEGLEILDELRELSEGTKTVKDIICPIVYKFRNENNEIKKEERPFFKLPFFSENNYSAPNSNQPQIPTETQLNHIPSLAPSESARTPNVSFLLSPAVQQVDNSIETYGSNNNTLKHVIQTDDKHPFLGNNSAKYVNDNDADKGTGVRSDKLTAAHLGPFDNDYLMNEMNTKDTVFQNILNIPNYFFDYGFEDMNSITPNEFSQ